jgi:cyclopropane-fatty-acyl-phospholipid synthase
MLTLASADAPAPSVPWHLAWCRRLVLGRLRTLGLPLEIREGGEVVLPSTGPAQAHIEILDPRTWRAVALDGSDGSGDAYGEGWWTSSDLTDVTRIFCRSRRQLQQLDGGMGRLLQPLHRLRHTLRRNSKDGARANIHAHYDLGNAFFQRWLDSTMTYSSAIFARPDEDLQAAQHRKLDRLFDLLNLQPGEHLVEIGTGWGELAIRAAQTRGVRVTTITISTEQHAFACARAKALGLGDRVQVRLCDYRDLEGSYDKLVSVEMVEAVGHQYHETYLAALGRLLKPTGAAAIQAITIPAQDFAMARDAADFIKRHIFPGSCIPSVAALVEAARTGSDLELVESRDYAPHYALTLERWRASFLAAGADLDALGYDARFRRLWEFYLSYCAGGFAERAIGLSHLLFAKPGWRRRDHAALVDPRATA